MIRGYQDDDYEELKQLYRRHELYGGVFDESRDGRERLASKIVADPEAILIYEQGGKLLGTISIIEDGRVAWLYRFVVLGLDEQISQKLYVAASDILKGRGHSQILVYTEAGNKRLDAHYNALGMNKGGNYSCFWKDI